MRVMVTGAAGFVGRLLVHRLLACGTLRGQPMDTLVLLDQSLEGFAPDPRLRLLAGTITDPALLRRALADGVDVVFHLVSIAAGAAEQDYRRGQQVNLLASLELLDQLRSRDKPPVLVYASSVAVYGASLPARLDELAAADPALSYGAHKLMIEIQLNDLSRRREIDGRALRLPGIVARPTGPNGLRTAFMSELMHAFADARAYQCPVSAQATGWWMSAACCVDNLLHAAQLEDPETRRVWQPPVLRLSIAEVVDALAETFGQERRALFSYHADAQLEALFGRYPPLRTPLSRALGFRHDGSALALVQRALDLAHRPRRARASTFNQQEQTP